MKKILFLALMALTCLAMAMVSCKNEEPTGPNKPGAETPTNPQEPDKPENPDKPAEPVLPKDSTTVFFVNADNWETVNAYIWLYATDQGVFPWPGKPATKSSEKVHDMDVYSYKYQTDQADMILFHNGIGMQSANVAIDATKPYFYNNVWYASLNEIPTPTPEPTPEPEPEKPMYAGYEYVDMGDGILWAAHNVGATSVGEVGDYYAWAETTSKEEYSWSTYVHSAHINNNAKELTKYCYLEEYGYNGYVDVPTNRFIDDKDSPAALNWGGMWQLPTKEDFSSLLENSILKIDHDSLGTKGVRFTSVINGNTLFFPYTGYIDGTWKYDASRRVAVWGAELAGDGFAAEEQVPSHAIYLHIMINQGQVTKGTYLFSRSLGLPIRPVVYVGD